MTELQMGTDTYQRRRAAEPDIRYINRFYEKDPTDLVSGAASIRRPGLFPRLEVGNGPIRRMFTQSGFADDDAFIVSGTNLYRLHVDETQSDNLTLLTGTVFGSSVPSMVASKHYLYIADGQFLWYTDGTAPLVQIPLPDDVAPLTLAIGDEFVFISIQQDLANGHAGDQFYWIEPANPLVVDPLDFATAESSPDIIIQLLWLGDQLVIIGKDSTEFWYGTGAADLPFSPIQGRPYGRGGWSSTGVLIDSVLMLVGDDGRVYEITDSAKPVSTPGIEERIRNAMQIQQQDINAGGTL